MFHEEGDDGCSSMFRSQIHSHTGRGIQTFAGTKAVADTEATIMWKSNSCKDAFASAISPWKEEGSRTKRVSSYVKGRRECCDSKSFSRRRDDAGRREGVSRQQEML